MNILAVPIETPTAQAVLVTEDTLTVDLTDGRTLSVPIGWFPRLVHAAPQERARWWNRSRTQEKGKKKEQEKGVRALFCLREYSYLCASSQRSPLENSGNIVRSLDPLWMSGFARLANLRQSLFRNYDNHSAPQIMSMDLQCSM